MKMNTILLQVLINDSSFWRQIVKVALVFPIPASKSPQSKEHRPCFASAAKGAGILHVMDLGSPVGIPQCGGMHSRGTDRNPFAEKQLETLAWPCSIWQLFTPPTVNVDSNQHPANHSTAFVHNSGAPLSLLTCHLFVPVWGRRFFFLYACRAIV